MDNYHMTLVHRRLGQMRADVKAMEQTIARVIAMNEALWTTSANIGNFDLAVKAAHMRVTYDWIRSGLAVADNILSLNLPDDEAEWGTLNPDLPPDNGIPPPKPPPTFGEGVS